MKKQGIQTVRLRQYYSLLTTHYICYLSFKIQLKSTLQYYKVNLNTKLMYTINQLCLIQLHNIYPSYLSCLVRLLSFIGDYDHPPVNLWNCSSLRVWLASLDRSDKKMYPPMNSWTTLQSAERQLKLMFSSSNWIIISLTSQLTFHAYLGKGEIQHYLIVMILAELALWELTFKQNKN